MPPLFPEEVKEKMALVLQRLEDDPNLAVEDIENAMIAFGGEAWPWDQAYREFLALADSQVGDHFFSPRLSPQLRDKYDDFRRYGGTRRDLHSGRPADFFTSEERNELSRALVENQRDLRDYACRQVIGLEQERYLGRVEEFQALLVEINRALGQLRTLADQQYDYPALAREIRARVRAFEYSLCRLGPELDYEAVCRSAEFFSGRRQELNRLAGIRAELD